MNPRVCICCGEPIGEKIAALSRNPNLCSSCSSRADGADDADVSLLTGPRAVESGDTPGAAVTAESIPPGIMLGETPPNQGTRPAAEA